MPFDGTKREEEDLVLRTLIDARAMIDTPNKWLQGRAFDEAGRHCLEAALSDSSPTGGTFTDSFIGAVCAVRQVLPVHYGNIASYNDAIDRTHDEILAVLDKAILVRRWVMATSY